MVPNVRAKKQYPTVPILPLNLIFLFYEFICRGNVFYENKSSFVANFHVIDKSKFIQAINFIMASTIRYLAYKNFIYSSFVICS